jgi:hypothetical protein
MEDVLVPLSVILVPLAFGALAVGKAKAFSRDGEGDGPARPAHRDPAWEERPPVLAAYPEPSAVPRDASGEQPEPATADAPGAAWNVSPSGHDTPGSAGNVTPMRPRATPGTSRRYAGGPSRSSRPRR